jgi:uncharacterized membrane protein YcjF (UPF0283 family)
VVDVRGVAGAGAVTLSDTTPVLLEASVSLGDLSTTVPVVVPATSARICTVKALVSPVAIVPMLQVAWRSETLMQ